LERDCNTCLDKVECVLCKRKLCHIHEPEPKLVKLVEGHYVTKDGTICVPCMEAKTR